MEPTEGMKMTISPLIYERQPLAKYLLWMQDLGLQHQNFYTVSWVRPQNKYLIVGKFASVTTLPWINSMMYAGSAAYRKALYAEKSNWSCRSSPFVDSMKFASAWVSMHQRVYRRSWYPLPPPSLNLPLIF